MLKDKAKLYKNIPQELRKLEQWVLWKQVQVKGKTTKVPYQINGRKASTINSSHWTSFFNIIKAFNQGHWDGIGFVFTENDPYVGVDLDNKVTDEGLAADARLIIDSLNSYTEYSQSGNGIHIILKGKLPYNTGRKNPKLGYEAYQKQRYFAITGDVIEERDTIEYRQNELIDLCKKVLFPEGNQESKTDKVVEIEMDDKTIIDKLLNERNGKAKALYLGDLSGHNNDHSAADQALCNKIAFYTKDFEQIDRIFRSSRLYRDKWDRPDYKAMTINKAIESVGTYNPEYGSSSPENDFEFINEGDNNSKLQFIAKGASAFIITNENTGKQKIHTPMLTLYIRLKYDLKYYNGTFRIYKNGYYALVDDIKRLVYSEIPDHLKDYKYCKSVEDNLSIENKILLKDYELAGPRYISFKNGVLDLKTMKLLDHSKELLFVNQIPHNYNPEPDICEYTEAFFKNACGDSQELRNFLLQIIGVTISEFRGFKNWFFFTGKKDTGKSTYLKIIQQLLTNDTGEKQYSSIPLSSLQNTESMEIWPIFGKKANIVSETSPEPIRDDTVLKTLTSGGDTLKANKKFSDPIEGVPKAILLFAGNNIPLIWNKGDKTALIERLLIYNFKHQIPKEKQIVNIEKKINYEYLIKLALDQLILFIKNKQKFIVPEEVLEMQQEVMKESDDVYNFISTYIVDGFDRISYKKLYELYKYWCFDIQGITKSFDINPLTQRQFNKEIRRHLGHKVGERLIFEDKNKKTDGIINISIDEELIKQYEKYKVEVSVSYDFWGNRKFS